jgi:hypothetical protein
MITSRRSDPSTQAPRRPRLRRELAENHSPAEDGPFLIPSGAGEAPGTPIPVGWSRIGRSPTADIRLDDPAVSRRHALLVHEADRNLQVIDDRSLSGVYVNGRRVHWAELSDGDELRLGDTTLIVTGTPAERYSTV